MIQAYEFAVDKVGIDYHSYQVIEFFNLNVTRKWAMKTKPMHLCILNFLFLINVFGKN